MFQVVVVILIILCQIHFMIDPCTRKAVGPLNYVTKLNA
jgi:hypothetical protein